MFNTKGKTKTRTRNYPHSNWSTKLYWDVFLNIIDDCSIVKKHLEDEKEALGLAIMNVQDVFKINTKVQEKLKIRITDQKLIIKLINFLQYGKQNQVKETIMINILEILTLLLHKAEQLEEEPS